MVLSHPTPSSNPDGLHGAKNKVFFFLFGLGGEVELGVPASRFLAKLVSLFPKKKEEWQLHWQ